MVRDDEKRFLIMVADKPEGVPVRSLIQSDNCPVHYKRAWYLLDKWSDRGWYDYGVNLELGWLEPEGRAQAKAWKDSGEVSTTPAASCPRYGAPCPHEDKCESKCVYAYKVGE